MLAQRISRKVASASESDSRKTFARDRDRARRESKKCCAIKYLQAYSYPFAKPLWRLRHNTGKFTPAVSTAGASNVAVQAYAKFAEIRLNPFVCVQPLQFGKAHRLPNPVQTETRRRASPVARPSRRLAPARRENRRRVRVHLTPPRPHMTALEDGFACVRYRRHYEPQVWPMKQLFISRYSSIPYRDPSRPRPDSLMPPKGATSVEIAVSFTPTMPYSSASMTRHVRAWSEV